MSMALHTDADGKKEHGNGLQTEVTETRQESGREPGGAVKGQPTRAGQGSQVLDAGRVDERWVGRHRLSTCASSHLQGRWMPGVVGGPQPAKVGCSWRDAQEQLSALFRGGG